MTTVGAGTARIVVSGYDPLVLWGIVQRQDSGFWCQLSRFESGSPSCRSVLVPFEVGSVRRRIAVGTAILYATGLKQRECELCGQGELWRGRAMSLILDHINGVGDDNRLENLRIVCPNCAATLDTHCGRNLRLVRSCASCGRSFHSYHADQRPLPSRVRPVLACGDDGAEREARCGSAAVRPTGGRGGLAGLECRGGASAA